MKIFFFLCSVTAAFLLTLILPTQVYCDTQTARSTNESLELNSVQMQPSTRTSPYKTNPSPASADFSVKTWKTNNATPIKHAVQLISPPHRATYTPGVITFQWRLTLTTKKKPRFHFFIESLDGKTKIDRTTNNEKRLMSIGPGKYKWRVVAENPRADSHWRNFKVIKLKSEEMSRLYEGRSLRKPTSTGVTQFPEAIVVDEGEPSGDGDAASESEPVNERAPKVENTASGERASTGDDESTHEDKPAPKTKESSRMSPWSPKSQRHITKHQSTVNHSNGTRALLPPGSRAPASIELGDEPPSSPHIPSATDFAEVKPAVTSATHPESNFPAKVPPNSALSPKSLAHPSPFSRDLKAQHLPQRATPAAPTPATISAASLSAPKSAEPAKVSEADPSSSPIPPPPPLFAPPPPKLVAVKRPAANVTPSPQKMISSKVQMTKAPVADGKVPKIQLSKTQNAKTPPNALMKTKTVGAITPVNPVKNGVKKLAQKPAPKILPKKVKLTAKHAPLKKETLSGGSSRSPASIEKPQTSGAPAPGVNFLTPKSKVKKDSLNFD